MPGPVAVHAPMALLPDGWAADIRIDIGVDGRIAAVAAGAAPPPGATLLSPGRILLPAPANLHSHAFQRAMAGMAEAPGGAGDDDDFWSWRTLMYRFLDRLTPDDVEAIAAMVQVEMLEAGFAAVCEFHYLHHGSGGEAYADPAEMGGRIVAAAAETGIGLALLPVHYARGGADGRPVADSQRRFACGRDGFARLVEATAAHVAHLPQDARLGVAPHSLRAVSPDDLLADAALRPADPVHIHVAEQTREVEEIEAATGRRPVEFLLDTAPVGDRWCLVHATHMTPGETRRLADIGAVAGLCPITEANLGDGLFDAPRFLAAGGRFGVGSDSNLRITLAGELRLLEEGQRLALRRRAVLASDGRSVGRTLLEEAAAGGARAAGRGTGTLSVGAPADLVAIDAEGATYAGLTGDAVLDAWIFADAGNPVREVWSAGRPVVIDGRHPKREAVESRFRKALARLRS